MSIIAIRDAKMVRLGNGSKHVIIWYGSKGAGQVGLTSKHFFNIFVQIYLQMNINDLGKCKYQKKALEFRRLLIRLTCSPFSNFLLA